MQKTIKINPYGAFVQYSGTPLIAGDVHAYRVEGTFPDTEDLTGATVVVDAYRPDGTVVTAEGAIDGKTAYCVLPNNMYAIAGEVRVRLKVLGADGSALTVVEIILNALETEDADITGDDRYPILNQLIAQANQAVGDATEAINQAMEVVGDESELKERMDEVDDSLSEILTAGIVTEVLHGYSISGNGALIEREGFKVVFLKKPALPWYVIGTQVIDGEYTYGTDIRYSQAYFYTDDTVLTNRTPLVVCSKFINNPATYPGDTYQLLVINPHTEASNSAAWIALAYKEETDFWSKVYSPYDTLLNHEVVPDDISEHGVFLGKGPNFVSGTVPINNTKIPSGQFPNPVLRTSIAGSGFFPIKDGKVYYHGNHDQFWYIHLYDADMTYLGMVQPTSGTALDLTDYPTAVWANAATGSSSAVYNPNTWVSDRDLTRQRNTGTKRIKPELIDTVTYRDEIKSWVNGKKIAIIGDSISAGGTGGMWCNYIKNRFGATVSVNAIGGTAVSGSSANSMWQDVRVNANPLDADIVIIFAGTNDVFAGNSWSIDNCDTSGFYGAYNVMMSKLEYKYRKLSSGYYASQGIDYSGVTQVEEANPNIRFVLVTPPYPRSNAVPGAGQTNIADAVVTIGKNLGYPVADLRRDGVNQFSAPTDYYGVNIGGSDGIHLNIRAHKRWAEIIAHTLLSIEEIELSDITV